MPRLNNRGFTLFEVLIAVLIVTILVGLVLITMFPNRERAFRAAMMSDLRNVATAQETYFDENGTYTNVLTQLEIKLSPNVTMNLRGDPLGWSAQAGHNALPSSDQCALFFGTITPFDPATKEGLIACS